MKKIKGFVRLMRVELPFSAGVCVVLGQLFALGRFASVPETLYGFFSVFLISASILVLNDYFDVETDRINAPDRPIPSNLISPAEALILSIILLLGGLILSFLLNMTALICCIGLLIIGFLYNRKFKKNGLAGNLMVSFSVGMTFIYGGISAGEPFNKVVWFFGVIAALVDLGEEIAADSMDVRGDSLINSSSIAIRYGKDAALRISSYIFSFVIFLTVFPFILNWFPIVYVIPIAIMDIVIAYSTVRLLKSGEEEGRKYIRMIYLGSTFGLVVFLVMRLMGV
ncbi:MAG: UbiA family prenyltransferase [Ignavibacteriaceae bacterium]